MSTFRSTVAAAALLVLTGSAARATTLFTPGMFTPTSYRSVCAIVNVGTTPITVSAVFRDFQTGADITLYNQCPVAPATLAPGAGCITYADFKQSGYCQFQSSSSRVRANIVLLNQLGFEVVAMPATK